MNIWILARRNLRIYFRDRAGVFFSFLSPLILIALYALFLGNQQVQSLQVSFPGAAPGAVESYINGWVFAGLYQLLRRLSFVGLSGGLINLCQQLAAPGDVYAKR